MAVNHDLLSTTIERSGTALVTGDHRLVPRLWLVLQQVETNTCAHEPCGSTFGTIPARFGNL
jgi:hypothetical protein